MVDVLSESYKSCSLFKETAVTEKNLISERLQLMLDTVCCLAVVVINISAAHSLPLVNMIASSHVHMESESEI